MFRFRFVLLTACLSMSVAAHAQHRVYKTVGPDGSVTFTDKPPAGQAPVTPTLATAPEPRDPGSDSPEPRTATERRAGAKKAIRKEDTAASNPPPQATGTPDPAALRGLYAFIGLESLVDQFRDLCLKTLPTSFKRYDGAAAAWKTRHEQVLARYPAVMQENLTSAQQSALRAEVNDRTRSMLAPVAAANVAQRIKWCDSSAAEINSGQNDLGQAHTHALMNYRKR